MWPCETSLWFDMSTCASNFSVGTPGGSQRLLARARRRRRVLPTRNQPHDLSLDSLTITDAERHGYTKDSLDKITTVEDFVMKPDDKFICPVCYEILTEPQLTECCGHHICGSCMKQWQNTSKGANCPYCTTTSCRYILDRHFQRELNALEVHCARSKAGCTWKGELGNLTEHQKDCPFVYVTCKFCIRPYLRLQVVQHESSECEQRIVRCDDCGTTVFYNLMKFHVEGLCSAVIPCPNMCGEKVRRCLMKLHQASCPNELVSCPFSEFGCFAYLPRRDLQGHVTSCNQKYTLKLLRELKNTQEERDAMKHELTVLKTTMVAAISSISRSIDTISQHSASQDESKVFKSIRSQLTTLSRPHLSNVNKVISLSMRKAHGQSSRSFYIFDGYLMRLLISMRDHNKLGLSLVLVGSDHDGTLTWPLEKHAQLYMSIDPGEYQTPFNLSQVGTLTKKVNRVVQQSGGYICAWSSDFNTSELQEKICVKLYCDKPVVARPPIGQKK